MASNADEEDYMSDSFLQKCVDTRPGLVPQRISRQYKMEEKTKLANQQNRFKSKKELEQEMRDTGLTSAISQDNKGFALLKKMGYKPGMSLGKQGTGRAEPVSIKIKDGRTGLGHDVEMKRKCAEMSAMRAIMNRKRQRMDQQQKGNFLQRMSEKFSDREIEKDLYKSQKVCYHLDSQAEITKPAEVFFWPELHEPEKEDENEDNDEEVVEQYKDIYTPQEKLEIVTEHLRSKYFYCIWCGTKYDNKADMDSHCPGDSNAAHM